MKMNEEERTKCLIRIIVNTIKKDPYLHKRYIANNRNRKYDIEKLLTVIIEVLRLSLRWRKVSKLKISEDIYWNTFYKTYIKLLNDKVLEKSFNTLVKRYLKRKQASKLRFQMTDTTNIYNKFGNEKVERNKYAGNKKITKVSLIADSYGKPLDFSVHSGNTHDSKILEYHFKDENCIINNNDYRCKKIMLADKGYDSAFIRRKLMARGYYPIIPYNKRNTKHKQKINRLTKKEKKILKHRINIEHTFKDLKDYSRLNTRYDRKIESFTGFIHLALIDILIKASD